MTGQILGRGPFPRRSLAEIFHAPEDSPLRGLAGGRPTGEAVTVPLPPLRIGARLFPQLPPLPSPGGATWDQAEYASMTPWVCEFREVAAHGASGSVAVHGASGSVAVHGDGGIVAARGCVVSDTMLHVVPERQGHIARAEAVILLADAGITELGGTWLSLLCGSHWNHYHWLVDGIGRLAAADAEALAACDGILVPADLDPVAEEALALSGIARWRRIERVAPRETVTVARLLVPWRMADGFWPHPELQTFLDSLVPEMPYNPDLPPRIWIDRRAAARRPLVNEAELIAHLEGAGVVPVTLEAMSLVEQAALFRQAELVVAPHGAGLTNVVFGRAPCSVVELVMDHYQHWGFRRLAALAGLDYDCVPGRVLPGQQMPEPGTGWVHDLQWAVDPVHLQAAIAAALAPRS